MQFTFIITQDLRTTASPSFVGMTVTGLTASEIVGTSAGKALVSIPVIGSGLTLSGGNLYWSWLGIDNLSETPDEDSMMVWNGPSASVLWESGNTLNHTLGFGTEDSPTFVGLTLTGTLEVTGLSTLTGGSTTGDGTNKLDVSTGGVLTLAGTARVSLNLNLIMSELASSPSAAPTRAFAGNTVGYKFSVNDYGYIAPFEIPYTWDATVQPNLKLYWYCNNSSADKLISWQIDFNAGFPGTDVVTAATTIVTTGITDLAVSATPYLISESQCALSGISEDDLISIKITRVAATGGAGVEPDDEPVLMGFELSYTVNKLGE